MSTPKIHFAFNSSSHDITAFAADFINELGQERFENADTIVSIGGDGALLHTFRKAQKGQKFFGMVRPDSNSRGFWTNRGIDTTDKLLKALKKAESFKLHPLKVDIKRQNGERETVKAFNEVSPDADSGQAMLINLTVKNSHSTIGPIRIMGDGLIIATPFGSTAVNATYGGSAVDIRNAGIAITGKGIYEPQGGLRPVVASDDSKFEIAFLSPEKRPVRIQYDGQSINGHSQNPFTTICIEKSTTGAVELLLLEDPSTRAFAAMLPQP